MPDITWTRTFEPVEGAFSRDRTEAVRLSFRLEGRIPEIPVSWGLMQGENRIASGDTLVPTAHRDVETVFSISLPGMLPGDYVLDVLADPQNTIEEKDERNNRAAFSFHVPNGAPVRFRCEGPEGSTWELYRVELNTSTGTPYPDADGTRSDTTRSTQWEIVVGGVEPGGYVGVLFGPTVNRIPILISSGTFEMPDPPEEIEVVWQRTTPYITGRPKVRGDTAEEVIGGQSGAPRWRANARFNLEGPVRNPTDRSSDVEWTLRFIGSGGAEPAERDTLLSLGALATEKLNLTARVPRDPANYLIQAEVRVPWPSGFEDLGEDRWVASHVLPLGWIEVQR